MADEEKTLTEIRTEGTDDAPILAATEDARFPGFRRATPTEAAKYPGFHRATPFELGQMEVPTVRHDPSVPLFERLSMNVLADNPEMGKAILSGGSFKQAPHGYLINSFGDGWNFTVQPRQIDPDGEALDSDDLAWMPIEPRNGTIQEFFMDLTFDSLDDLLIGGGSMVGATLGGLAAAAATGGNPLATVGGVVVGSGVGAAGGELIRQGQGVSFGVREGLNVPRIVGTGVVGAVLPGAVSGTGLLARKTAGALARRTGSERVARGAQAIAETPITESIVRQGAGVALRKGREFAGKAGDVVAVLQARFAGIEGSKGLTALQRVLERASMRGPQSAVPTMRGTVNQMRQLLHTARGSGFLPEEQAIEEIMLQAVLRGTTVDMTAFARQLRILPGKAGGRQMEKLMGDVNDILSAPGLAVEDRALLRELFAEFESESSKMIAELANHPMNAVPIRVAQAMVKRVQDMAAGKTYFTGGIPGPGQSIFQNVAQASGIGRKAVAAATQDLTGALRGPAGTPTRMTLGPLNQRLSEKTIATRGMERGFGKGREDPRQIFESDADPESFMRKAFVELEGEEMLIVRRFDELMRTNTEAMMRRAVSAESVDLGAPAFGLVPQVTMAGGVRGGGEALTPFIGATAGGFLTGGVPGALAGAFAASPRGAVALNRMFRAGRPGFTLRGGPGGAAGPVLGFPARSIRGLLTGLARFIALDQLPPAMRAAAITQFTTSMRRVIPDDRPVSIEESAAAVEK